MSVIFIAELMIIALIFNLGVRMVCLYRAPYSLTTNPITCKRIFPEGKASQSAHLNAPQQMPEQIPEQIQSRKVVDDQPKSALESENKTAVVSGPLPGNPLRPVALVTSADADRILESYIDDFLSVGESTPTVLDRRETTSEAISPINQDEPTSLRAIVNSLQDDFSYAANS